MANDQSTTAVPAPAEPQTPVTGAVARPVATATAPAEHTVTTPEVLPDLQGLIGGTTGLDEEPKTDSATPGDPQEPLGIIVSRP